MTDSSSHTVHANFVLLYGQGVLIFGTPKIGKSLLSLALIDRGHQLISDDATSLFYKGGQLMGSCPTKIENKLQTNSLGLLEINQLYPAHHPPRTHPVHLVIEIKKSEEVPLNPTPLQPHAVTKLILNQPHPLYLLPLMDTSMLALSLEILVKTYQGAPHAATTFENN